MRKETLAALRVWRREIADPRIREHRGRIVKTTGDGFLVEFASVVDAVHCAVTMQHAMAGRNAGTPPERRIEFRVGINLGDIISQDDDIFGDGVNAVARLAGLAEPGGICISRVVRDQIRDKLPYCVFEDMGEQKVKNIARSVRAYAMSAQAVAAASPALALRKGTRRRALSLLRRARLRRARHRGRGLVGPAARRRDDGCGGCLARGGRASSPRRESNGHGSRLSIVVLPFENLSHDPDQEYFADGITEDLDYRSLADLG